MTGIGRDHRMKARTGPRRTTTAANISAADGKAIAATSITTIVGIVVGNAMNVAIVEIMVVGAVAVEVEAIVMIAAAKTNADGTLRAHAGRDSVLVPANRSRIFSFQRGRLRFERFGRGE